MAPTLRLETTSIVDPNGDLCIDVYHLYNMSWLGGSIILATPNIPLVQLEELRLHLTRLANAESLDLDVIIAGEIENGAPKETVRWRLGWEDSLQFYVHLFPQEFFQLPNAEDVYKKWVNRHQAD